jgi:hypothetical protein
MKRWLISGLAVSFAACTPSVPSGPDNSSKYAFAEFDPANAVIPLPNDLAFIDPATNQLDMHLHAPTTGGTAAQNEFNQDYLNQLDGFPMESTATVLFDKPIDFTTVNGASVPVIDITNPAQPVPGVAVGYPTSGTGTTLAISPPAGGWLRGHRYAIAVIGGTGAEAVKGASGTIVTGSATWALVSSDTPLIICDQTGANCQLQTSAIPTTAKDPATQLAQQIAIAKQLEALRLQYAPLITALGAPPLNVKSSDIAVLWTFAITSQAEVTFDPLSNAIPFPNDILIDQQTGKVAIPANAGLPPDLVAGLNTLDGFSTTGMIISEFSPDTGPLLQGKLPGTSYTLSLAGPINMVQAELEKGAKTVYPLRAHACVNCPPINMLLPDGGPILLPDGGVKPDTLAIVPDAPLTERARYAVYITTDLKDNLNKNVIPSPVFALVRSSSPLFDGTHSTVSILTDGQAQALEQLRSALEPFFTNLASQGLPRKKVALAWTFTTQTTMTALTQLNAIPTSAAAQAIPGVPLWVAEITPPAGVPNTDPPVHHWYIGEIIDVFLLTGTGGTLNPAAPATPKIPFVMSVPTSAAPAGGYPTTIYGHGLTRTRLDGFIMSASLASAGQVMIAIDEPWHGDRNTCTGFGAFLTSAGVPPPANQDLFACVNPNPAAPTQACNAAGRCQSIDRSGALACNPAAPDADKACMLAGQGHCAADSKCENGAFASVFTPAPGVNIPVNGWNLLNLANFFATRDNFRQQVVSHAQLARVISSTDTGNLGQQAGGITLNPAKISYDGQSLGGILGSLYTAASPVVKNAALNVPGGDPELILLTSPAFAASKAGFQAGLAAQGVPTDSPLYDIFLIIAKWIIDPADPLNAVPYLVRDTGSNGGVVPNGGSSRRAYVQWIQDDQVVPNLATQELIRSVLGDPTTDGVLVHPTDPNGAANFWAKRFPSSGTPANNHGFLLGSAGASLAATAQGEIAGFIAGAPPIP